MAFTKIKEEELVGKGVVGLPDRPSLSTLDMQKKFDELARDVIIPKFNKLSDELESSILDTLAEVEANTEEKKIAGALALKELARNMVFIDGRPTSANINPADYKFNSMVVMQATTSMTEGKPPVDGFIITNIWDSYEYATQTCYSQDDDKIYRRRYILGEWTEWKGVALESDFLPLTGGTLTGWLEFNGGNGALLGMETAAQLIHQNNGLRTNVSVSETADLANAVALIKEGRNTYNIFGEHNKPSGSYTGNGSATTRTIDTGGLGDIVAIYSPNVFIFLTISGGIVASDGGVKTTSGAEMKFENGVITLNTGDISINYNGVTYYYQVL